MIGMQLPEKYKSGELYSQEKLASSNPSQTLPFNDVFFK
jgi:hypothetical protein